MAQFDTRGGEFTPIHDKGRHAATVRQPGRLQVVVPDSRVALARLCQALAGDPFENLLAVGVTGTCGRTMTSVFIRSIFEATGARFGLVGALGWSDGVAARSVSTLMSFCV